MPLLDPNQGASTPEALFRHFSRIKDSECGKLPHGFVSAFEKRLQLVFIGRERVPEYSDAVVKRAFTYFYIKFTKEDFWNYMDS